MTSNDSKINSDLLSAMQYLIHQSDFKDHVYFVNQLLTLSASTKNNLVPINVIKNVKAMHILSKFASSDIKHLFAF